MLRPCFGVVAALLVATVAHADASLEAALVDVPAPAGCARVIDPLVVWRDRVGRFVSVAAKPGRCVALGGAADPLRRGYYRLPVIAADRTALCLQRVDDVVVVTIGSPVDAPIAPAAVATLTEAIAARPVRS